VGSSNLRRIRRDIKLIIQSLDILGQTK